MGMGYLQVEIGTAFDALPVPSAQVEVADGQGEVLYTLTSNANGVTETVALEAPDGSHTLDPADPGPYYATYDVSVQAPGYSAVAIYGVQIFDGQTALLPVEMIPAARGSNVREIIIPDNTLLGVVPLAGERPGEGLATPRLAREVVIPDFITVHLGTPASSAQNVRVRFTDYIKNVASGEIYPTWPQAALEANIYCQISFALNRIYTEWYPSRGYVFHITSSTAYDQTYADGRNIFANISAIVDTIFNQFVRRVGYAEPYFTQYCNGTTVTCRGLSQWGTVPLANQGMNAYQILRSYYPADIQVVASNNIAGIAESYPGTTLRQGSQGESVRRMQLYLNRIRINYPLIPEIAGPNGVFGSDTAAAVTTFQRTFSLSADGIIGKATWYKIISIYNGVKRLAELDSEGERIGIGANPPNTILRQGSRGSDVVQLQFILNTVAEFYHQVPTVLENASFDARTQQSVRAFQSAFGLTADGIVGPTTWQKLYEIYRSIDETIEIPPDGGEIPTYPGSLLRNGSRGEGVRTMQLCLNRIFGHCPGYALLSEDGIFGMLTQQAVVAFQRMEGLAQDGIIGPITWERIASSCADS